MDLNGKIALITGATSGIGRATATMFAENGATLVLPVRELEEGKRLREELLRKKPSAEVHIYECDLSSLLSVQKFISDVKEHFNHLNLLINNAGVFPQERKTSVDGHELNLVVNYLAPVLLTSVLLDLLKKGVPSRIINVASSMCKQGTIDFSDIESKKFDRYKAYAQSKLAIVLFTKTLGRKLRGSGITVNALHPGVIETKLALGPLQLTNSFFRWLFMLKMESPRDGAKRIMYLATSPEVTNVSGEYFEKNKIVKLPRELTDETVVNQLDDETKKILKLTD